MSVRVERCSSCGARYNVASLPEGRSFACRRCGAAVRVATSAAPSGRSTGLVVAGSLMLLSLLLYAHPTIGVRETRWPWEHWLRTESALHRADLVLWTFVGVLAVLVGAGALRRAGAAILLPAVVLLALRCYAVPAAFEVGRMSLTWMVAAVALGAGFLGRASAREPAAGAVRPLLAAGALALVAIYAVYFPSPVPGSAVSFGYRVDELAAALRGDLTPDEIWGRQVPFLAQAAAVLLGLALAVLPRGVPGTRFLAASGFASLLLTWILPLANLVARTWEEVSGSARQAAQVVGITWFSEGLALFLVGSLAVVALVARGVGTAEGPRVDGPRVGGAAA